MIIKKIVMALVLVVCCAASSSFAGKRDKARIASRQKGNRDAKRVKECAKLDYNKELADALQGFDWKLYKSKPGDGRMAPQIVEATVALRKILDQCGVSISDEVFYGDLKRVLTCRKRDFNKSLAAFLALILFE